MKRQNGFTLTELLVVTAIVSIMLAIGVPSYRYITNSYRLSAEANSLLGDMQYARAEAIKEGQFVVVCASAAPYTTCANNTVWNAGWIVFSDANGNNQVDAGETLLHVQQAFAGTVPDSLTVNVNGVRFNREGFATALAGVGGLPTAFTLKDGRTANAAWQRCVLLTAIGTSSTQTHVNDPADCP